MEHFFGISELYDVSIIAIEPIEIGDKRYETNETIINFEKVLISNIEEEKDRRSSNGGYRNTGQVFWEETRAVSFTLTRGVVSQQSLSLLSNSKLINNIPGIVSINFSEEKEAIGGVVNLKYAPNNDNTLFVYKKDTKERVRDFEVSGTTISGLEDYKDYLINYTFQYEKASKELRIGDRLTNGYIRVVGKTRLKDNDSGHNITGVFNFPKVKLMSELSMRLGKDTKPVVQELSFAAFPANARKKESVCEFLFLEDEIDGDF